MGIVWNVSVSVNNIRGTWKNKPDSSPFNCKPSLCKDDRGEDSINETIRFLKQIFKLFTSKSFDVVVVYNTWPLAAILVEFHCGMSENLGSYSIESESKCDSI